MAVVNVISTAITNAQATPRVPNNPYIGGAEIKEDCGFCALASGDDIASTYRFARVRSNARVSQVLVSNTAVTTCAADVGLYRTAADGGAVVDADFFASALSLATAASGTDCTSEAGGSGSSMGNLTKAEMPIWQVLGLTADPNIEYEVAFTLTAAAGSAGTVFGKVRFVI